eukprot:4078890-Pleurochrysis_carterae.AAC.1
MNVRNDELVRVCDSSACGCATCDRHASVMRHAGGRVYRVQNMRDKKSMWHPRKRAASTQACGVMRHARKRAACPQACGMQASVRNAGKRAASLCERTQ